MFDKIGVRQNIRPFQGNPGRWI